ncbi:FAD-dependent monooxygenase [Streptomyces albiaxialis]|uniref:FAD-dependent monooxygenase n=1 Tax=Streptomyces albiaxialis TaxID=329523 RepID=A0ABN2W044_9ACTN
MSRTTGSTSSAHATGPATSPATGPAADPARAVDTDVIVVGAGPTGLLLAGDLAASGHSVTLVERRSGETSNLTRALVVHARTLEQLDARGLAEELIAVGHPVDRLRLFGHATLDPTRLPTRFPFVLVTPQFQVERLLEARARKAGVVFRHGAKVTALRQDAEGAEVDLDEGASGVSTLRGRYLVGTDGVHSTIREALGLPFPGKSVIRSIVLADVRLSDPPASPFAVAATDRAFALAAPFGDGWYRVMGWSRDRQLPDGEPVELDEVKDFTRRALGTDFGMHDPRWMSRFHSDERQAPSYRVGRAFLAGDAAHVHSPAGGQGMNTGLQDAANLSWKLSMVLQGRSPESLLDTYETERHPVGKQVLRSSGAIIRLAIMTAPGSALLRTLTAGAVNRIRPLGRRAMRTISGLSFAYATPDGAHPLAGKRAPDLALASGRLYEALREGRFVLVTPRGSIRAREEDPRVVHAEYARGGKHTLLIRPDGHIAWAADGEPTAAALRQALTAWTGPETTA